MRVGRDHSVKFQLRPAVLPNRSDIPHSLLVCLIDAVIGADKRTGAVSHEEFHAGEGQILAVSRQLLNHQCLGGLIGIAIGNPPLLLPS